MKLETLFADFVIWLPMSWAMMASRMKPSAFPSTIIVAFLPVPLSRGLLLTHSYRKLGRVRFIDAPTVYGAR